MPNVTVKKQIVRSLASRLDISVSRAAKICDADGNWEAINDIIYATNPIVTMSWGTNEASIWGDINGYHDRIAEITIPDDLVAKWNAMPMEQAYSLPADVQLGMETVQKCGQMIDAQPRNDDGITVVIVTDDGSTMTCAMLAQIGTAQDVLNYANECIGDRIFHIEMNPRGDRAIRADGMPIVEMIMSGK